MAGDPRRAGAIILGRGKWANGTVLHYCFFTGGHYAVPKKQADAIRDAFAKWKAVGIGLQFEEVTKLSEAEVRIGYSVADGSSASGVGREILTIPVNEPTTVYGWDLTSPYGRGTALHELGHVLGMEHEHPPNNWPREVTFHNILEKLTSRQVQGSKWDPDSIMEYEFGPGLIDVSDQFDQNGLIPPGTLSSADKEWAASTASRASLPVTTTARKTGTPRSNSSCSAGGPTSHAYASTTRACPAPRRSSTPDRAATARTSSPAHSGQRYDGSVIRCVGRCR